MEAHKGMLWDFYIAFELAYGPPPPWPADRTGDIQELQRAFFAFAKDSEFLQTANVTAIWQDYLWVSRNGELKRWKPKPIDTHNQPT